MNQKIGKYLVFCLFIFLGIFSAVYADGEIFDFSTPQQSSGNGSNNSFIKVDSNLRYINKNDDSTIIGNYFSGFYYDTVHGYFNTKSLSNPLDNVHIVSATTKCSSGYGYKLGGYAYSESSGYVDFDYNEDVFVYYCESDSKLHGFAYSDTVGFQNFEGIVMPITENQVLPTIPVIGDFYNDRLEILNNNTFSPSNIEGQIFQFDVEKESLFYIIK